MSIAGPCPKCGVIIPLSASGGRAVCPNCFAVCLVTVVVGSLVCWELEKKPTHFWMVERSDPADWDEFARFVVRASSAEEALQIAKTERLGLPRLERTDYGTWFASFVPQDGEPEIILADFHAG